MKKLVMSAVLAMASLVSAAEKPNFVVIFIDDMGYGDIGPFGSTQNQTPQLDRMAEEGMRLTSFYVASPVCTPSRAALMTGCYPKRVGLAKGSWGIVLFPKDPHGLSPKETTIAEVLKDAGYATGCFGKWHLGDQPEFLPTAHGFDTYYGIPYSNDMWPPHPPSKRWKNGVCPLPILQGTNVVDIVEDMDDQAHLCRQFTEEAVAFIRKNKDRPFFCYVPHAFIHYPRRARPEFMEKATAPGRKKLLEAQVEEVDWSAGEILRTIRELGLAKKTLVLFTSDNGPAGGSAGPFRGHKGQVWEGGMREPTIAWWPGAIPAGSTCGELCTTMDLLPTFAALGGGTVPGDRVIDGKDITPLLFRKPGAKTPHGAFYYFRVDRLEAVRSGSWKLHARGQLYNLDDDIGESRDVAKQNPDVVARLKGLMAAFSADLAETSRPVGKVENPAYLVSAEAEKPESAAVPDGSVFADFEGKTYGAWKAEGTAFGMGPARGTLPRQMRVSGMHGRGMVNSYLGQDRSTGSLTSPEFTIEKGYITFLIGGGRHPNTALELLVGGRSVRHATGRNSETLRVEAFDVRGLKGETARLRIVDHNTGGWGHVLVDHITFTDTRAVEETRRPAVAYDTGLAPEVTDLNAADVSYAKEKEIKYLQKPYISTTPADRGDGIPVGKLGVDGGSRELVLAFADELARYKDDQHLTDSLLISYKGKLLFESYYRRGRQNYPHYQMSITKSYTALALGRAIQLGHFSLDNLHKPVVDFLTEVDRSKIAEGADRITLDNAMHMGSGIRLDGQKVKELMKDRTQLKGQGQVRAYLENTAPIPEKDIAFKYQASDPALAMQVVDAVVPGSAEAFIRTELLAKLGITNYGWQEDLSGLPKSAAGCSMRSRDMLKIGMMLMADGKWQGKPLIPEAFVKRALSPLAHSYGTSHYGYFWWVDDFKAGDKSYHCPAGRGAGGQFILMFPELELIVVITAHNKGMGTMLQDAPKRIIPAFMGT